MGRSLRHLGASELKTDPRFQERDTRKKNRAELTPLIEEKLKTRSTGEWVERLNTGGIPSGDILSLEQALDSSQVKHRETTQTVEEPELGPVRLFGLTAKFEKSPGRLHSAPPRLGAQNGEVLGALGYSAEEISALRESGAI